MFDIITAFLFTNDIKCVKMSCSRLFSKQLFIKTCISTRKKRRNIFAIALKVVADACLKGKWHNKLIQKLKKLNLS